MRLLKLKNGGEVVNTNSKKEEYRRNLQEYKEKMHRGDEFLKREKILIYVEVEGCPFCGNGNKLESYSFTEEISLAELPQHLKWCHEPFWKHPKITLEKKEDPDFEEFEDSIPYEEKQWGIYKSLVILRGNKNS